MLFRSRWMLASSAVPALIIVLLRIGTPESPRWLVKVGRYDEATKVLKRVYGPNVTLADLPEEAGECVSVGQLLKSGYGKRMAFITIFWTCSIVPLFAVYAFGPAILEALKLGENLAHVGSAAITVMFLVGCLVAVFLVNRMGRRPLIIHSFLWSGLALLAMGLFPDADSRGSWPARSAPARSRAAIARSARSPSSPLSAARAGSLAPLAHRVPRSPPLGRFAALTGHPPWPGPRRRCRPNGPPPPSGGCGPACRGAGSRR